MHVFFPPPLSFKTLLPSALCWIAVASKSRFYHRDTFIPKMYKLVKSSTCCEASWVAVWSPSYYYYYYFACLCVHDIPVASWTSFVADPSDRNMLYEINKSPSGFWLVKSVDESTCRWKSLAPAHSQGFVRHMNALLKQVKSCIQCGEGVSSVRWSWNCFPTSSGPSCNNWFVAAVILSDNRN